MANIEQMTIALSAVGSILTVWAYLTRSPAANWLTIITGVTLASAVLFGVIRRISRIIIAGFTGLTLILCIKLGYILYSKVQGWLQELAKTGWVSVSDISFAKNLIILLPLIIAIAVVLIVTTRAWKGKMNYRPLIKPVIMQRLLKS